MTLLVWIEYHRPSLSGVKIEIGSSSRRRPSAKVSRKTTSPFNEEVSFEWICVKVAAMWLFCRCHWSETWSLLTLSFLLSLINFTYIAINAISLENLYQLNQYPCCRYRRYAACRTVTVSLPDLFLDKADELRMVGQHHFWSRNSFISGAFKSTVSSLAVLYNFTWSWWVCRRIA